MHICVIAFALGICLTIIACQGFEAESGPALPDPPAARIVPKKLEEHGQVRIDDYYWLNDRDDPEVLAYLEAENAYARAVMAHTEELQGTLFDEIKGRIKPNDESVPYKKKGWYYYTRFEAGEEYPVHCRKEGSLDAPEEVMIDANDLAKGHDFFSMRGPSVSFGGHLIAYGVDIVGRRKYTLHFKNLETGEILKDTIPEVTGNVAWANDDRTIFYTKQDPDTLRSYRIYRHVLGTDSGEDALVYEEKDETFSCRVVKTKTEKYVMIASRHTLSSEYRYLDADDPGGEFKVFLRREKDHEYSVSHYKDKFYIRTNYGAKNFRFMETFVTDTGKDSWREVIPHREDVFLQGSEIFRMHLVVSERRAGLTRIRIIPWDGSEEHYLDFGEPAYTARISTNPEFDTHVLRYVYTSMTTPNSTYDYDMITGRKTLLKRDEVLGGFDSNNYRTERLMVPSRDGKQVPVSLVYRKGIKKDGSSPLLLYGYGSYGASMDAWFNAPVLSLLDRGFVYALAHVRGGQEFGREWYEDGKLFKKKNTFNDFIDCAEHLIREKYTSADRLFAMGGSAGGLLMGAVVNMRPDLFKGVAARVPFVDVITTMLDESIPLTTSEYDEWGNPHDKDYYDYMLSYSPYDNVKAEDYPNLIVTTGLHDSQVQYWEPAKWVARLRALKTDGNRLLLVTNMEAGHGGASGRYRRHKETALIYAFFLDLLQGG